MSSLKIYNGEGACVGEHVLPAGCEVADKGAQAMHDAVVTFLANQRSGTASTLSKGAVSGSNRKPWRQKGTGRARAGLRQSPVWRGGGVAFGPHPRSFARKLPRQVARLAFQRAFSERVKDGVMRVLSAAPELAEPRTRLFAEWIRRQEVVLPALLVFKRIDDNLRLAARNFPGIELVTASHVNTYQILRHAAILVMQDAMPVLQQRLGAENEQS